MLKLKTTNVITFQELQSAFSFRLDILKQLEGLLMWM